MAVLDLGKVAGIVPIDDSAPSAEKLYSSQKTQHELDQLSQQKANKAGWTADKFLGTDANGNMVVKDAPESGADPLAIYPVGSVYMSANSTSPASLFGGTWEQIKARFLLGAGDSYALGSTGGEAQTLIAANNLPEHNHTVTTTSDSGDLSGEGNMMKLPSNYGATANGQGNTAVRANANNTENLPINNMPPYLVVFMWKRVS
jgi:hypothetical protein